MPSVARVGDTVTCPACLHFIDGTPATPVPLPTVGNITSGSSKTFVFGMALARKGDTGTHAACIGRNSFEITGGSTKVFDLGKEVARVGDATQHCGGLGTPGPAPAASFANSSPGTISTGSFTVIAE